MTHDEFQTICEGMINDGKAWDAKCLEEAQFEVVDEACQVLESLQDRLGPVDHDLIWVLVRGISEALMDVALSDDDTLAATAVLLAGRYVEAKTDART